MAKCKSCRATISFVASMKSGRRIPVNPGISKSARKQGEVVVTCAGEVVVADEGEIIEGFESHFATCPEADKHRKGGKKRGRKKV